MRSGDPADLVWLVSRLVVDTGHVHSFVPRGFSAYARVLHPVTDLSAVPPWPGEPPRARWADVLAGPAGAGGLLHRPRLRFDDVLDALPASARDRWGPPEEGELEEEPFGRLCDHLAMATATPDDCRAVVWDGGYDIRPELRPAARVSLPHRDCWIFTATLDDIRERGWSPEDDASVPTVHFPAPAVLWWPVDRAWVVSNDVDSDSTLVAGAPDLVAGLTADAALECVTVDVA